MTYRFSLSTVIGAAFLLSLLLTPAVRAADLKPDADAADPRLQRVVSVRAAEMRIEDLLAELQRQTGVAIRCGNKRDLGGEFKINLSFREVPLKDAMSALWSLVSNQGADWHWHIQTRGTTQEYLLFRPQTAQTLPARLLRLPSEMFEAQAQFFIAAAEASPAERAQMAEKNAFLKKLLSGPKESRSLLGHRAFAENVPKDKRLAVLRGQVLRIPFDQLGPIGQSYIRNERDTLNGALASKGIAPVTDPLPTWMEYRVKGIHLSTPSLMCLLEGRGGNATFGGLPLALDFHEYIRSLWMRPGDVRDDPREAQVLQVTERKPVSDAETVYRLNQVADAAPLSYMAFAIKQRKDSGNPNARTLLKYLEDFERIDHQYLHKWRGKILLIEGTHWYWSSVPYPPEQQLR